MANGDIGSLRDTRIFTEADARYCSMVHCLDDYYAIAYRGAGSDGFVITVKIPSTGLIDDVFLSTLEFDTAYADYCQIFKVTDTIFAVAYTDENTHGKVTTFAIVDGVIGAVLDDLVFDDSGNFVYPYDVIKVGPGYFAIVCAGPGVEGWVHTVLIDGLGGIQDTVVDTLKYEAVLTDAPKICHVSGSTYAIIYRGAGNTCQVCTLSITSAGVMPDTPITTLQIDSVDAYDHDIVKVHPGIFACINNGSVAGCTLRTVSITGAGVISLAGMDTQIVEAANAAYFPSIHIGLGIIAVSFVILAGTGNISTYQINADGSIDNTRIDTFQYEALTVDYLDFILAIGNYYLVGYRDSNKDVKVRTFDIETPVLARVHHEMIMGMGP